MICLELFKDLLEVHFAIATIRDRYFDGHPTLFREYDNNLPEQVDVAEALPISTKLLDLTHPP